MLMDYTKDIMLNGITSHKKTNTIRISTRVIILVKFIKRESLKNYSQSWGKTEN